MSRMRTAFLFACLGIGALASLGVGLATIAVRLILAYGPSAAALALLVYLAQDIIRYTWTRRTFWTSTAKHAKKAKA